MRSVAANCTGSESGLALFSSARAETTYATKRFPPRASSSRHHHRFPHQFVFRQPCLDLPQLDAEPADLHLLVVAPEKFNIPILQIPPQVPGLVHPLTGTGAERIRHESLRRHLRSIQIPSRYTHASDIYLSHCPQRHWPPLIIQGIDLRICNRSTDRDDHAGIIPRTGPGCYVNGCFRRSIQIVDF